MRTAGYTHARLDQCRRKRLSVEYFTVCHSGSKEALAAVLAYKNYLVSWLCSLELGDKFGRTVGGAGDQAANNGRCTLNLAPADLPSIRTPHIAADKQAVVLFMLISQNGR